MIDNWQEGIIKSRCLPVSLKRYGLQLKIKYGFNPRHNGIELYINDNDRIDNCSHFGFTQQEFNSTCGSVYQMILYHLSKQKGNMFMWGDKKEDRLARKYSYIRANWAGSEIYYKIWKDVTTLYGITKEETQAIKRIQFRNTLNKMCISEAMMRIKCQEGDNYKYALSDLQKYPQGLCRNIIEDLNVYGTKPYDIILKSMPKQLFKCNYIVSMNRLARRLLKERIVIPKNLIQWRWLETVTNRIANNKELVLLTNKLTYQDVKYYKGLRGIGKSAFAKSTLGDLKMILLDGIRIEERWLDNPYDILIHEIKGSPKKMIQKAIFNHNQQREISRQEIKGQPNWNMPKPPIALPEWLEDKRLKTAHDLIIAGEECHHCIGSYTDSNDIFIRDGDVCVQIDRNDYQIVQCYDINDRHTEKSRDLENRINKSLQKIRGELDKYSLSSLTRGR